jgi:hypothetical protein
MPASGVRNLKQNERVELTADIRNIEKSRNDLLQYREVGLLLLFSPVEVQALYEKTQIGRLELLHVLGRELHSTSHQRGIK